MQLYCDKRKRWSALLPAGEKKEVNWNKNEEKHFLLKKTEHNFLTKTTVIYIHKDHSLVSSYESAMPRTQELLCLGFQLHGNCIRMQYNYFSCSNSSVTSYATGTNLWFPFDWRHGVVLHYLSFLCIDQGLLCSWVGAV